MSDHELMAWAFIGAIPLVPIVIERFALLVHYVRQWRGE